MNPSYAKGFRVTSHAGYRLLDIQDPQQEESTSYHFALNPRGTKPEGYFEQRHFLFRMRLCTYPDACPTGQGLGAYLQV